MGTHVANAIRGAGIDPVVVIGGTPESAAQLEMILVPDQFPGEGPLGGTASALGYFTGTHVLVAACDMPLLEAATITRLLDSVAPGRAVIAAVDRVPQLALACWPRSMYRVVLGAVRDGQRRWSTLLELTPFDLVEVPALSVADADDAQTLSDLLADGHQ